jgi:hypothetical protein
MSDEKVEHVQVLELDVDGATVRFSATKQVLGRFDEPHVKEVLRVMPYDAMSANLTKKIWVSRYDKTVCPVCGENDFREQQMITSDVDYGFCGNCQTTLHRVRFDGKQELVSYPRHAPYVRVVNTLMEG